MRTPPADRSRDPLIDDPSNIFLVHPLSRLLLGPALAMRIGANTISIIGTLAGIAAAFAYYGWRSPEMAVAGLGLSLCWLVADGLDGMVARATGTASPLGRLLDGICDHLVFLCLYISLALSVNSLSAWLLLAMAGACHFIQSSLYESERARFHRRAQGDGATPPLPPRSKSIIVRAYNAIFHAIDHRAEPFDAALRASQSPRECGDIYRQRAARPLRLMIPLSANMRVFAIFLACISGRPLLFWWFEILPLSIILLLGLWWHRSVEKHLVDTWA